MCGHSPATSLLSISPKCGKCPVHNHLHFTSIMCGKAPAQTAPCCGDRQAVRYEAGADNRGPMRARKTSDSAFCTSGGDCMQVMSCVSRGNNAARCSRNASCGKAPSARRDAAASGARMEASSLALTSLAPNWLPPCCMLPDACIPAHAHQDCCVGDATCT